MGLMWRCSSQLPCIHGPFQRFEEIKNATLKKFLKVASPNKKVFVFSIALSFIHDMIPGTHVKNLPV